MVRSQVWSAHNDAASVHGPPSRGVEGLWQRGSSSWQLTGVLQASASAHASYFCSGVFFGRRARAFAGRALGQRPMRETKESCCVEWSRGVQPAEDSVRIDFKRRTTLNASPSGKKTPPEGRSRRPRFWGSWRQGLRGYGERWSSTGRDRPPRARFAVSGDIFSFVTVRGALSACGSVARTCCFTRPGARHTPPQRTAPRSGRGEPASVCRL